jgi:hypothetical protein
MSDNENPETAENKVTDNNPEATLREVRIMILLRFSQRLILRIGEGS